MKDWVATVGQAAFIVVMSPLLIAGLAVMVLFWMPLQLLPTRLDFSIDLT